MRGAWIGHHAHGLSTLCEENEKFTPLEGGHTQVRFAVKDEQRGCNLVGVHHGGKLQERSRVFSQPAHIIVNLRNVARGDEAEPVRDARTLDRRFVAMRLRDRPRGHESARAPAKHGQAIWISPPLSYGKVGGAVDIGVSAVAKVLIDGLEELGAVTGRATVLRLHDSVAHAGD